MVTADEMLAKAPSWATEIGIVNHIRMRVTDKDGEVVEMAPFDHPVFSAIWTLMSAAGLVNQNTLFGGFIDLCLENPVVREIVITNTRDKEAWVIRFGT